MAATKIPATLIPGDGIGPEVAQATVDLLDALGSPFVWDRQIAGVTGLKEAGDPLPKATLESLRKTRLGLKGPLATPVGGGFRSSNVRLREEFQLYANLRPAHTLLPGGRFENIDLVLIRENLEGLYVAFEHYIPIGDDPHAVARPRQALARDDLAHALVARIRGARRAAIRDEAVEIEHGSSPLSPRGGA